MLIDNPILQDHRHTIKGFPGQHSKHAPHIFMVWPAGGYCGDAPIPPEVASMHDDPIAEIKFQDGALNEENIPGVFNEDLIVMIIARLQAFQETEFKCAENAEAIGHLEEALSVLASRTKARKDRCVEGTHTP